MDEGLSPQIGSLMLCPSYGRMMRIKVAVGNSDVAQPTPNGTLPTSPKSSRSMSSRSPNANWPSSRTAQERTTRDSSRQAPDGAARYCHATESSDRIDGIRQTNVAEES
jgi:hypothetical protein